MDLDKLLEEVRLHRQQSAENVKRIVGEAAHVKILVDQAKNDTAVTSKVSADCDLPDRMHFSGSLADQRQLKLVQLRVMTLERENESLKAALSVVAHQREELIHAANATQDTVTILRKADDRRSEQMHELRERIIQGQRDEERNTQRERAVVAEFAAERAQLISALHSAFVIAQQMFVEQEQSGRSIIELQRASITDRLQISLLEMKLLESESAQAKLATQAEQEAALLRQALHCSGSGRDDIMDHQVALVNQSRASSEERHQLLGTSQSAPKCVPSTEDTRMAKLLVVVGELEQQLAATQSELRAAAEAKRELQLRLAKELAMKEAHENSTSSETSKSEARGPSIVLVRQFAGDDIAKFHRACQTTIHGHEITDMRGKALELAQAVASERKLRLSEQSERARQEQRISDLEEKLAHVKLLSREAAAHREEFESKLTAQLELCAAKEAELNDLKTLSACLKQDLTTVSEALTMANDENKALALRVENEMESARRALNMHARLHAAEKEARSAAAAERAQWDEDRCSLKREIASLVEQLAAASSGPRSPVASLPSCLVSSSAQTDEAERSTTGEKLATTQDDEVADREALLQAERSHSTWLLQVAEDKDAENQQLHLALRQVAKYLREALRSLDVNEQTQESPAIASPARLASEVEAMIVQLAQCVAHARRDHMAIQDVLASFLKMHSQLTSLLVDDEVSNAVASCQEVLLTTLEPDEAEALTRELSPLTSTAVIESLGDRSVTMVAASLPSNTVEVFDKWPQLIHRISVLCQLVKHHQTEFTKVRKAMFDLKAAFLAEAEARLELEQVVRSLGGQHADDDPSSKRVRLLEIADDAVAALQSGKSLLELAVYAAEKLCHGSEGSPLVQQLYENLDRSKAAIAAAQSCCDWVLDTYLGVAPSARRQPRY